MALSTKVAPELLRCVPLQVCLQGMGKHWASSSSERAESAYELSQRTSQIDHFLSHDWGTSRWVKFVSLTIRFNSRAAGLASLCISLFAGLLATLGLLPVARWTAIFGFLTYFVVLLAWQNLRAFFGRPILVFLDKICISQTDHESKQEGIRGLAAFLECSECLTILWSRRYFARLWCVYELATFLKDPKKADKIEVLPVKESLPLVICSIYVLFFVLILEIGYGTADIDNIDHSDPAELIVVVVLVLTVFCTMVPLQMYVHLALMQELQDLPSQIHDFKIEDSKCSCCALDHVNPRTGENIMCDRKLIFDMLQIWFGNPEDLLSEEPPQLDVFDKMVRENLRLKVLRKVGHGVPEMSYVLATVCMPTIPFLSYELPMYLTSRSLVDDPDAYLFYTWHAVAFLSGPLVSMFWFWVCAFLCRRLLFLTNRCPGSVVAALVLTPLSYLLVSIAAWFPLYGVMTYYRGVNDLHVYTFLGVLLFTLYLYSGRTCCCRSRQKEVTKTRSIPLEELHTFSI